MYYAERCKRRGWRVKLAVADSDMPDLDLFGAVNETVARETAAELTAYRAGRPR